METYQPSVTAKILVNASRTKSRVSAAAILRMSSNSGEEEVEDDLTKCEFDSLHEILLGGTLH